MDEIKARINHLINGSNDLFVHVDELKDIIETIRRLDGAYYYINVSDDTGLLCADRILCTSVGNELLVKMKTANALGGTLLIMNLDVIIDNELTRYYYNIADQVNSGYHLYIIDEEEIPKIFIVLISAKFTPSLANYRVHLVSNERKIIRSQTLKSART